MEKTLLSKPIRYLRIKRASFRCVTINRLVILVKEVFGVKIEFEIFGDGHIEVGVPDGIVAGLLTADIDTVADILAGDIEVEVVGGEIISRDIGDIFCAVGESGGVVGFVGDKVRPVSTQDQPQISEAVFAAFPALTGIIVQEFIPILNAKFIDFFAQNTPSSSERNGGRSNINARDSILFELRNLTDFSKSANVIFLFKRGRTSG